AETSALSTAIMESLDGVRVVKIENREAFEEARVAEVVRRREKHLVRGANARARAAPATELLMTLITALVFVYAGWRSREGGKSTLLNLIPRFYDATEGRVLVDGRDVREVTLASLRGQIGLVTQEPFLFDDSIRANIAYARPDASPAEIEAAARAAAAHDFITALSAGYETSVGEAGARLSGGQRQRIAIARAFLKDAPILLLDEATSALDTESEAQVQAALKRLMAGRATLLIAHRLSTVRGADRIYVIDKGRIVETGDHASLVDRRGLYDRHAKTQ